MSRITADQTTFRQGNDFMEVYPGGPYGDGVEVMLLVRDHVTRLTLTTEEAREIAAHLTEIAELSDSTTAAKDAAYERAEAAALAAGKDAEEAARIAGEASAAVTAA